MVSNIGSNVPENDESGYRVRSTGVFRTHPVILYVGDSEDESYQNSNWEEMTL